MSGQCQVNTARADAGFLAAVGALTDYVDERGRQDADAALRGHLVRLLGGMLESSQVRLRALDLTESGDAAVVAELRARLGVIATQRRVIADRCAEAACRPRQQLEDAASAAIPVISGRVAALLDSAQEASIASIATADLDQTVRDLVETWISAEVADWRAGELSTLRAGLQDVSQQARRDVDEQLGLVRAAVRDSLALEIGADWPAAALVRDPSFHVVLSAREGWEPPMASLYSRLGTSKQVRARTMRRLRAEIPDLVDRQVGRNRSDLHHGLDAGARELAASLEQHVRTIVERVDAVLEQVLDRATDDERDRLRAHEAERRDSLEKLAAEAARTGAGLSR